MTIKDRVDRFMWKLLFLLFMGMLIPSLALAASVQSPLPSLEGKPTILMRGNASDQQGRTKTRAWRTQRVRWESMAPQFFDTVRLLGGKLVDEEAPVKPGMRVLRYWVETWRSTSQSGDLQLSSVRTRGRGRTIAARIDVQMTEIRRGENGRLYEHQLAKTWAEGASAEYSASIGVSGGRTGGRGGGSAGRRGGYGRSSRSSLSFTSLNFTQSQSADEAERSAIQEALQRVVDSPRRTTSVNEPLVVTDIGLDGEIEISAGADRKIREGQTYGIYRRGDTAENSWTGEVIEQGRTPLAVIRVTTVMSRRAICEIVEGNPRQVLRGDFLKPVTLTPPSNEPARAPQPRS